jgi:hypothetical protein
MGIRNQLWRAVRSADESWCCESCRRAALAGRHGPVHHQTEAAADPAPAPAASRRMPATANKP